MITFRHVSAVIRLAHKYQFEELLKQSLKLPTDFYTPVHARWIKRDSGSKSSLYIKPTDAIDVIDLARLTGTDIVLPLAFLQCATLGSNVAWGYMREDRTRIYLAKADLGRTIHAHNALLTKDILAATKLGPLLAQAGAVEGCTSTAKCREASTTFWPKRMARVLGDGADALLLRPWRDVVCMGADLCQACRAAVVREDPLAHARNVVWRNLPDMLGLKVPAWQVVQRGPM